MTRNNPFVCTYNAVLNVTLNTLSISGKGCHHGIEAIEVEFLRKFYSLGIYMSQNFEEVLSLFETQIYPVEDIEPQLFRTEFLRISHFKR